MSDTAADRARLRLGIPPQGPGEGVPPLTPSDQAAAQTALLTRLAAAPTHPPSYRALAGEVQTLAQIVLEMAARITALEDRS
jgi:hypothetical protein